MIKGTQTYQSKSRAPVLTRTGCRCCREGTPDQLPKPHALTRMEREWTGSLPALRSEDTLSMRGDRETASDTVSPRPLLKDPPLSQNLLALASHEVPLANFCADSTPPSQKVSTVPSFQGCNVHRVTWLCMLPVQQSPGLRSELHM